MKERIQDLVEHARQVRIKMLDMGIKAGGGHLAPGFSCTEILVALYDEILKIDPGNPHWKDRDRFILSKGHGCMPLYVLLADKGFFDKKYLDRFCKPGSILGCHPDRKLIPGLEATTGSLGLGLSIGVGMALAGKHDKNDYRVFVLLGDAECQEGTIWEALMYAGSNELDNLTVIVDYNRYGATARIKDTSNINPLPEKLKAFNFSVTEVNGHDFSELLPALKSVPHKEKIPSAVIAQTTKGKGISFMEEAYKKGDPKWHYRIPEGEEIEMAIKDLEN